MPRGPRTGPHHLRDLRRPHGPSEAGRVLTDILAANGEAFESEPVVDFIGPPELIAKRWRPFLDLGFTSLIVALPAPYDRETIERLPEVREMLVHG